MNQQQNDLKNWKTNRMAKIVLDTCLYLTDIQPCVLKSIQ